MARLLATADFGIVAIAVAVTGVGQAFADLGLSEATIQREDLNDRQVSALFWINVAIGLAHMLLTTGLAPVPASNRPFGTRSLSSSDLRNATCLADNLEHQLLAQIAVSQLRCGFAKSWCKRRCTPAIPPGAVPESLRNDCPGASATRGKNECTTDLRRRRTLGDDTDFYLRKGFTVVAIEANPALAEKLRGRFRSKLSDGSLSVIEAAIAENPGEVDFYVNKSMPVWGTIRPEWAERNASFGCPSQLIKVKALTFVEVLMKYGVPYYLKIDIEGADLLCLNPDKARILQVQDSQSNTDRPTRTTQSGCRGTLFGIQIRAWFEQLIRRRDPWKMVDGASGNPAIRVDFSKISSYW